MVLISGAGASWSNATSLKVGDSGNGALTIDAGGVASSARGFTGTNAGTTGVVTVADAGSAWNNSGTLSVGYDGNGVLNIEAGGTTGRVTVTGANSIWDTGDLSLNGETLSTLDITNGGKVISSRDGIIGTFVDEAGAVTVNGVGSSRIMSRTLTVGRDGDGTLNIEAGGTVSGTSGRLWQSQPRRG